MTTKCFEHRVLALRFPFLKKGENIKLHDEEAEIVAQLGREGWEMVAAIPSTGGLTNYLGAITFWKREIPTVQ